MDFNALITAIMTNGIGGVCAAAVLWFAYYRETKTIPKMLDTFQGMQAKAIETFAQLTREERAIYQIWHNENRARLDQLVIEARETRHYLRDMAHAMGLKRAVDEERRKKGLPEMEEER